MVTGTLTGQERIARAFGVARAEGRLALIVYVTVGYPDRDATLDLARSAVDAGADIIELGVPFSDPLADGTTVQRASDAALRHGVTLEDCVRVGTALVRERDVPVLLMGYTNPFLQRGYARLARELSEGGIAGVIVPDMPSEESAEIEAPFGPAGLARVDLYAPTTPEARLAELLPRARGFVYCVSLTGVTGVREALGPEVGDLVARVRRHTTLPVAVGFGISTSEHVRALRGLADGVVVGSAALDAITRGGADGLRGFVASLREAAR